MGEGKPEPGSPKIYVVDPGAPLSFSLSPCIILQSVETLKTFAVAPEAL